MVTINKEDLIPILQDSKLVEQFENSVTIPKQYRITADDVKIKYEFSIRNDEHFHEIMNKLRFHMVKELPHEIYEYVLIKRPDLSNYEDFFFDELSILDSCGKSKIMNWCARKGSVNLMKFLHKNGFAWEYDTAAYAASSGNLECLEYAFAFGCIANGCVVQSALRMPKPLKKNIIQCIDFLIKVGVNYDCLFENLAGFGLIELVKKYTDKFKTNIIRAKMSAGKKGQLECLKYLHSVDKRWSKITLDLIFRSNKHECFKFAHNNGCTINNTYFNNYKFELDSNHIQNMKNYASQHC